MYLLYLQEAPSKVMRQLIFGQWQYAVNYEIKECAEDEGRGAWQFKQVILSPGVWDYDSIVNALVSAEYPSDKMQAIINNYLIAPDEAEVVAEFTTMQNWRKEAKRIAKEALEYATETFGTNV